MLKWNKSKTNSYIQRTDWWLPGVRAGERGKMGKENQVHGDGLKLKLWWWSWCGRYRCQITMPYTSSLYNVIDHCFFNKIHFILPYPHPEKISISEDFEKLESFCKVGSNVKWYSWYGKPVPQETESWITKWSNISTSSYIVKRN